MTLCECGCGEVAPIAPANNTRYGWTKGRAKRFIHGHHWRGKKRPERSAEHRARLSASRLGKMSGPDHWNWRGGRTERTHGYTYIKVGRDHPMAKRNGYCAEHRLVMSEAMGRMLLPEEVVHHINHDGKDNRPENLMLFPSQSEHMRFHRLELEAA